MIRDTSILIWLCPGATQEALVEQYNDQLRELREAGLSERAEEMREALRTLRDEERAPESSVKVGFLTAVKWLVADVQCRQLFSAILGWRVYVLRVFIRVTPMSLEPITGLPAVNLSC